MASEMRCSGRCSHEGHIGTPYIVTLAIVAHHHLASTEWQRCQTQEHSKEKSRQGVVKELKQGNVQQGKAKAKQGMAKASQKESQSKRRYSNKQQGNNEGNQGCHKKDVIKRAGQLQTTMALASEHYSVHTPSILRSPLS